MVVDRKKTEGTSSAGFAPGPQPNAVNSSVVPTEFAAGTENKDEDLEGKFVT